MEMACKNNNGVGKAYLGMTDKIKVDEYNRILGLYIACLQSVLFEAGTNIKIYGIR